MARSTPCSRLRSVFVLMVVVVVTVLASSAAAQATPTATPTSAPPKPSQPAVTPTPTPSAAKPPSNATTTAPPPTPTPTPSADTYAVPAPSALPGSKDFAYTPNVQCTDLVANATFQIYSRNRLLFDHCVVDGKYQIFPYPGQLPSKAQIDSMVRATSCRSVFTACVLANLPQCDIGGMALKSATETLLKISVDVLAGKDAPDSKKFYEMLLWRRDVNLAQAKGIAYDQSSQLYGEYSRNLWRALTNTNVKVSPDLKISIAAVDAKDQVLPSPVFANITTGSDVGDIRGKVKAPDTNGTNGSFSNNATATTKSASGPRAGSASGFVAVALAAASTVLAAQW